MHKIPYPAHSYQFSEGVSAQPQNLIQL